MVEETKQIKFTMKELAAALEAKAKDWKNETPPGSVSGLFQDKDKKLIVVEYRAGKHDFQLVRYKYETVAAAIVQYCRKLNIPFPKKADKTLTVYKTYVQILIEYPPLKGAGWAFRQANPGET